MNFMAWIWSSGLLKYAAAAAVGGAIAGAAAWNLGELRLEAAKGGWAAQQAQAGRDAIKATEQSIAVTAALQKAKDEALSKSQARAIQNRNAAVAAGSERDGLRDELAQLRDNLPSDSCATRAERASTLTELLDFCTGRLGFYSGKAQGHLNDALTQHEAWPRPVGQSDPAVPSGN